MWQGAFSGKLKSGAIATDTDHVMVSIASVGYA